MALSSSGDVKSAVRVIQIFQLFAELKRPLPLSSISVKLAFPKSSCLALLKTLEAHGYLYQINDTRTYYPTRRLLLEGKAIAENDPFLSHVRPLLQDLCDATNETVFLAKRTGMLSHYVEVLESDQTLRYAATVGEKRPLHIGAAGQSLLAAMDENEREAMLSTMEFEKFSSETITSAMALRRLIEQGKARGWFMSIGGYQSDVASIGNYVWINGEAYAIVVAAPTNRLKNNEAAFSRAVLHCCSRIIAAEMK